MRKEIGPQLSMSARMPMKVAIRSLVFLVVLFAASVASAERPRVQLRVQLRVAGPAECIQATTLARDVDGILERNAIELTPSPTAAAPSSLAKVVVTVGPDQASAGFKAVLRLETPDGATVGTREVLRKGPSCSVLDGPLAVVTALLVDAAEDSVRLVVPAPPPPVALPRVPDAVAAPPPRSPWLLRSEVAGTFLVGLLPTAAGARVDMQVVPPDFVPLLVRFDVFPHTTTSGTGPGGDFLALSGSVGVCPATEARRLRLDACVGTMFGFVRATGRNVPFVGESTSAFAMLFAEGGAAVRLAGPLSVRASVGIAGGLHPSDWHVDAPGGGQVVVWDPWPVTLLGSLGLVLETSSAKRPGGA